MKNLTEYIVKLMDEDSMRVISEHENMIVSDVLFDHFVQTCETTAGPNKELQNAAAYAKTRGFL